MIYPSIHIFTTTCSVLSTIKLCGWEWKRSLWPTSWEPISGFDKHQWERLKTKIFLNICDNTARVEINPKDWDKTSLFTDIPVIRGGAGFLLNYPERCLNSLLCFPHVDLARTKTVSSAKFNFSDQSNVFKAFLSPQVVTPSFSPPPFLPTCYQNLLPAESSYWPFTIPGECKSIQQLLESRCPSYFLSNLLSQ